MEQLKDNSPSPCIDICILNDDKICEGCFRTLEEIANWKQMDEQMRRDVLRKAENRSETL